MLNIIISTECIVIIGNFSGFFNCYIFLRNFSIYNLIIVKLITYSFSSKAYLILLKNSIKRSIE